MLPLIPGTRQFSSIAVEAEVKAVPGQYGKAALDFLDIALGAIGERSVFYISFGTEHWLKLPDNINSEELTCYI